MEDLFDKLNISDELKDELHAAFYELTEKAQNGADAVAELTVELEESNTKASEVQTKLEEAITKLDAIDMATLISEKTEGLSTNERANALALFDLVENKTAEALDTIVASIGSELNESVATETDTNNTYTNLLY